MIRKSLTTVDTSRVNLSKDHVRKANKIVKLSRQAGSKIPRVKDVEDIVERAFESWVDAIKIAKKK